MGTTRTLFGQAELTSLTCKIKKNREEINRFDMKLAEGLAKGQKIDLNMQTLNHILSVTGERLEHLVSRKIKQNLLLLDVEKGTRLINVSISPKLGNQNIAETVSRNTMAKNAHIPTPKRLPPIWLCTYYSVHFRIAATQHIIPRKCALSLRNLVLRRDNFLFQFRFVIS